MYSTDATDTNGFAPNLVTALNVELEGLKS